MKWTRTRWNDDEEGDAWERLKIGNGGAEMG